MTTIRSIFKLRLLSLILLAMGGFVGIGCGNKLSSEDRRYIQESLNLRDSSDQRGSEEFELDTILCVDDEFPCFILDDDEGAIWTPEYAVSEELTIPTQISFKGRVDLQDGTRYICREPNGCVIRLKDCVITQGKIKVQKKDKVLGVNDKIPRFSIHDSHDSFTWPTDVEIGNRHNYIYPPSSVDEPPRFSIDDIYDVLGPRLWIVGDIEVGNRKYPPGIFFKGTINLRNGTRYICRDDGCIIRLKDFVVTRGKIEVQKKDKVLGVNDKFPCFILDDDEGAIWTPEYAVSEERTIPTQISFKGQVDLQDGTRYICREPNGCIIRLKDCVVTQGKIEVHKIREAN